MEMFEFVFVYGYLIFFGLLPAIYEYEKACRNSYREILNQYWLDFLSTCKVSSHSEWVALEEMVDSSRSYFVRSRNFGGNYFFF